VRERGFPPDSLSLTLGVFYRHGNDAEAFFPPQARGNMLIISA
jgi:hypothetical protein